MTRAGRSIAAIGSALCAFAIAGCASPPVDGGADSTGPAVFRLGQGPIPRALPAPPRVAAGSPVGAAITMEGMWSGSARTDDGAEITCTYDPDSGRREYSANSRVMRDHHGSENYPREDFYGVLLAFPGNTERDPDDEDMVGAVVYFADETGTLVQMAAPDSASVDVRTSGDNRVVTFSMINAPTDKRDSGRPTAVVGTISCPN